MQREEGLPTGGRPTSHRSGGANVKERFVPIRCGIAEHLLRGDISAFEFGVYVIVHLQADYSTGIWRGSAPRILNSAPPRSETP